MERDFKSLQHSFKINSLAHPIHKLISIHIVLENFLWVFRPYKQLFMNTFPHLCIPLAKKPRRMQEGCQRTLHPRDHFYHLNQTFYEGLVS